MYKDNNSKYLFLMTLLMELCLINFATESVHYFGFRDPHYLSVLIMAAFSIILLSIAIIFKMRFRDFHYVWALNHRQTIIEALLVSVIVGGPLLWGLEEFGYLNQYFEFVKKDLTLTSGIFYICSAILQQLFFRGMFLNFMEEIYLQKWPLASRVLFSSTIFSLTHEIWGVPVMFMTFIGNAILHLVYEKQKNLLGVIIIHIVYGLTFFPFFALTFKDW